MACISDGIDPLLSSRIEDAVRLCEKRCVPCFLGFLDQRERAYAQQLLQRAPTDAVFSFWGGYPDAERTMLSVSSSYYAVEETDYPLCAIAFRYRPSKQLTHRDVLGTLMSVGVRRDAVGDILCGDGLSVVFVREEISSFICDQVDRIGGEGVAIVPDYDGPLPICEAYEDLHETIASPRIDGVVKALVHCSRERAAEMIRFGLVSINHMAVESASKNVSAEDILSIRGYGRYYIDQIGPQTKKGRLVLLARRRL